jgi:hypothetical protein
MTDVKPVDAENETVVSGAIGELGGRSRHQSITRRHRTIDINLGARFAAPYRIGIHYRAGI